MAGILGQGIESINGVEGGVRAFQMEDVWVVIGQERWSSFERWGQYRISTKN
jgi:hypothetical protein